MKRFFLCLFFLASQPALAQPPAAAPEARQAAAESEVTRARAAQDPPALVRALAELGRARLERDDSAGALAAFRESLKLAREIDEQPTIAANLLAIGRLHVQAGRLPAGAETLRRAVATLEPLEAAEQLLEAHTWLNQAHARLGQYRQAYESAQRATELGSALSGRRLEERVAELEARFEAERTAWEAERASREQELLRQGEEAAGRRGRLTTLAIAGGAALLLLALGVLGYRRLRGGASRALAAIDSELEGARRELEATADDRDRLSTLRDHAVGECDRLSAELERAAVERDRLSADRDAAEARLERSATQLEQQFIELKQTSAERDRVVAELERASSDRDRAVTELTEFAGERDRQAAALQHTTAEIASISDELEQAISERDRHHAELTRVIAEGERISDDLMRAVAERDRAVAERDRAVAERDQTAAARDRLTDQLTRASDELARLRADFGKDISAMADRNAAARERLTDMERFNSTLSQHLKVLLVAVRSSLGALQQDASAGDVEQLKADVRRTHLAVGKTVRLIDELQKLLRVGRVAHALEAASMSELAYEAVGQVADLADRRVEVVISPAMPAFYGDRAQLLEVLRRLLENGGKFMGDQPSPRLQVGHRRDWPKANVVEDVFYVRDNGIGIDARDHGRVFTLFEKLDPETGGLGVGLPLVRRVIEAHGGRVWVESDGAGRGSTFCFTLAKKYAAPPATRAKSGPAPES